MPASQPGARRVDDRRVVSGILHMPRTGGRRRDVPADYGPATTVYNRFDRRSRRGFRRAMPAALAEAGRIARTAAIDGTCAKAHRCAHGAKRGGPTIEAHVPSDILGRPAVVHLTPGKASDVKTAPAVLAAAPGRVRRLDRLARNYASAVALAAVVAFWC